MEYPKFCVLARRNVGWCSELLLIRNCDSSRDFRVLHWDEYNREYWSVGPDCGRCERRRGRWYDVSKPHSLSRAIRIYEAEGGEYEEDRVENVQECPKRRTSYARVATTKAANPQMPYADLLLLRNRRVPGEYRVVWWDNRRHRHFSVGGWPGKPYYIGSIERVSNRDVYEVALHLYLREGGRLDEKREDNAQPEQVAEAS